MGKQDGKKKDAQEGKMPAFRPTVLADKEGEYSGRALIDRTHMEGLIMQECSKHNIYHSNAFMVVTGQPSEKEAEEKYDKIQNAVFFNAYATICREEWCFCSKDGCKNNDAKAAEFVIEKDIVSTEDYKGIGKIEPIVGTCKMNADRAEIAEQEEGKNGGQEEQEVLQNGKVGLGGGRKKQRTGIRYVCPLTKLDEFAFPVKLYERKMGVLIVGQISSSEHREELERHILQKMSGCQKCGECKLGSFERVQERIRELGEKELSELEDRIVSAVVSIEDKLEGYYEERQKRYAMETVQELISKFVDAVNSIETTSESLALVYPAAEHAEHYKKVGECVKEYLGILCDKIGAEHREIFVPNFENLSENVYDTIKNGAKLFDLKSWTEECKDGQPYCIDPGKFISGITSDFDMLLVEPSASYPIAMALCSDDFLRNVKGKECELLKWTVNEMFHKFAEYAQMKGVDTKSEYYRVFLDSYMSIQRHELGQSNAGYQLLIEDFKKQRNTFADEKTESGSTVKAGSVKEFLKECDNFIKDSEVYLQTTMLRIQSTKYLIDFSQATKVYFYPYETFLFKWRQIYEAQVRAANLKFDFPHVHSEDQERPMMYGDPFMIEQAAYNLTNNAIKYALPWTEVSLDCRLNSEHTYYEIVVENYGRPFENESETKDIFQFGRRGSNNLKEGNGLGLFLTKAIARAHDGDVTCEMEKFSDYNWCLLQLYIEYYESKEVRGLCKDKELYENLKREREQKEEEITRCVTMKIEPNAFTPMYVHSRIRSGTAKFRFTFQIPYKR